MPELPEVETVRRDLASELLGARVTDMWTSGYPMRLKIPQPEAALRKACTGRRFVAADRRAKYLLLQMEQRSVIVVHLGMSGQLSLCAKNQYRRPHTHVVWRLDDGRELRFVDPRRFGFVKPCAQSDIDDLPEFRKLGVDPLSPKFTDQALLTLLRSSKRRLKLFLLDQSQVCGLGNIYVCEAMFEAGLHPNARANRIGPVRATRLRAAISLAIARGLENRGTSLRDYVDGKGQGGNNQFALRVYGQDGKPCPRQDGGTILRKLTQGRSTFYCPRCQRP